MSYFKNNNYLYLIIGLLILFNISLLSFLFFVRPPHGNPPPRGLARELGLNKEKSDQLVALIKTHFRENDKIRKQVEENRKQFIELLDQKNQLDSSVQIIIEDFLTIQKNREEAFANHYLDIKALCNPTQQQKLKELFSRNRPNPPGPGRRPPGRRN